MKASYPNREVLCTLPKELLIDDYITHASLDMHEDVVGWFVSGVVQRKGPVVLLRLVNSAGIDERSAYLPADVVLHVERDTRE